MCPIYNHLRFIMKNMLWVAKMGKMLIVGARREVPSQERSLA